MNYANNPSRHIYSQVTYTKINNNTNTPTPPKKDYPINSVSMPQCRHASLTNNNNNNNNNKKVDQTF